MSMPDTPTPPSPEPPREREGEPRAIRWLREYLNSGWGTIPPHEDYRIFGSLWLSKLRDVLAEWDARSAPTSATTDDDAYADIDAPTLRRMVRASQRQLRYMEQHLREAERRLAAASLPPSAGTRETDQRFDDPVEQIIATLEGGPTVADARKPLALRITHAIHLLRKLHPKPAPPSAGSGGMEDELVREPSTDDALLYEFYEASWRFASNHNGLTSLNAKRFNAVRKQLRARLAAHPAGPTRAEEGEADYIAQLIGDLAGVVERKEPLNAVAHALLLRKAAKLLRRSATPTTEAP